MTSLPRINWWAAWLIAVFSPDTVFSQQSLSLHTRRREPAEGQQWGVTEKAIRWEAANTAIVVCDMWDKHWCPDATERVGELAPVMNRVINAARTKGVFIIHCPSDTMDFYKQHSGRKLAQSAPLVKTAVPLKGWCSLEGQKEPPLPIDDSDGGCDSCPDCKSHRAWSRQHPGIEIKPGDAITDSVEAFYLMRQRGITNVIVLGVHENMCVLGRPFSIRQMVAQGQNVLLMRDMTDSMYNHRQRPYVSHFVGTDLVCEHIEKYWCASITSSDFLGGAPFRFKADQRKTIAFVIGENEYNTSETLPAFARRELAWRGYNLEFVLAPDQAGDPHFNNLDALRKADLVVLSVRRRTPSRAMMALLREHVRAGKPVAGIRTASHAFDAPPSGPEFEAWPEFDTDVLGMDYQGHYGNKPPDDPPTVIRAVANAREHPVLTGLPLAGFRSTSHLYKNRSPGPTVRVLLDGRLGDDGAIEPLAWVNTREKQRVFYTSLGNPADFQLEAYRRLLLNGLLWCLDEFVPPAEMASKVDVN